MRSKLNKKEEFGNCQKWLHGPCRLAHGPCKNCSDTDHFFAWCIVRASLCPQFLYFSRLFSTFSPIMTSFIHSYSHLMTFSYQNSTGTNLRHILKYTNVWTISIKYMISKVRVHQIRLKIHAKHEFINPQI